MYIHQSGKIYIRALTEPASSSLIPQMKSTTTSMCVMSPPPKLRGESSASPSTGNRMLLPASPYTCRISKALFSMRKIHFKATTAPAVRTPSWMHTSNLIVSCAPALTHQGLRLQSFPRLSLYCHRLRSPRRRLPPRYAPLTAWRPPCRTTSARLRHPPPKVFNQYRQLRWMWSPQ